jgi:hypothetical protein
MHTGTQFWCWSKHGCSLLRAGSDTDRRLSRCDGRNWGQDLSHKVKVRLCVGVCGCMRVLTVAYCLEAIQHVPHVLHICIQAIFIYVLYSHTYMMAGSVNERSVIKIVHAVEQRVQLWWRQASGFRLQASGFRDRLILRTCEREGLNHWQYHKVAMGELGAW